MIVKRYRCTYCWNEFWGAEGAKSCPYCSRKDTIKMEQREWDIELSSAGMTNRK